MKKKVNKPKTTLFEFWKDNKVAGHFQLNGEQLKERFSQWLPGKVIAWLEYYGAERVIRSFITEGDPGLSSVFEESQFREIYDCLKQDFLDFMKEVDNKISELRLKGGAVTTDPSGIISEVQEREKKLMGGTFNELR